MLTVSQATRADLPSLVVLHRANTRSPCTESRNPHTFRQCKPGEAARPSSFGTRCFLPEERLEQLQRPNMGYNPPPHGQAPGPRNPMLSRHVPDSGHLRPRASFAGAASFLRVRNRSIQYATDTCLSPSDKAGPILFAHFFEVAQPLCITLPNLVHPPAFGSHVWSGSHPCSLQMPIRYERAAHTCLQDLFPLKDLF